MLDKKLFSRSSKSGDFAQRGVLIQIQYMIKIRLIYLPNNIINNLSRPVLILQPYFCLLCKVMILLSLQRYETLRSGGLY
jgi:hypothetical protein